MRSTNTNKHYYNQSKHWFKQIAILSKLSLFLRIRYAWYQKKTSTCLWTCCFVLAYRRPALSNYTLLYSRRSLQNMLSFIDIYLSIKYVLYFPIRSQYYQIVKDRILLGFWKLANNAQINRSFTFWIIIFTVKLLVLYDWVMRLFLIIFPEGVPGTRVSVESK